MSAPTSASAESAALMQTLTTVGGDKPTACSAWRVHEIAAHLAAGAKEHADLIEHRLAGDGERATRGFEERELPVRALDHDAVLDMLVTESRRKVQAYAELQNSDPPDHAFTGTRFDKARSEIHSRSEAALHRWDIEGDDDVSRTLLAQPDLLVHAVWVLDNIPVLTESARAIGARARLSEPTEIAFRAPDEPDVVLTLDPAGSRCALAEQATDPALVLTLHAHHRPLVLWGRRPAAMAPAIEGDRALLSVLEHVVWPDATLWP